jgi:hypothetical protein
LALADLNFTPLKNYNNFPRFSCGELTKGERDLNEFLCTDSFDYERELRSKTYLFENDEHVTVAFFSVSNDLLFDNGNTTRFKSILKMAGFSYQKRKGTFPAVKIGRLGVRAGTQSSGIGAEIIKFVIGITLLENKSACRFLIVDAYNNERTIKFYQKNGFDFLLGENDKNEETRSMYLDLLPHKKALEND